MTPVLNLSSSCSSSRAGSLKKPVVSLNGCRVGKPLHYAMTVKTVVSNGWNVNLRKNGQRSWKQVVHASSAEDEDDEDFEARLAALKRAKGETPYGGSSKKADISTSKGGDKKTARKTYDYTGETVYFETTPHLGDLAVNVALGVTLVWLPLSFASVGRAAFVKYRFTDKRISCITSAPWQNEQLDAAYQEVKDVVTIGRGIGLWGDMVITLNNGDKIEMRALPRFIEMKEYILKRRDELTGGKPKSSEPQSTGSLEETSGSGFA